MSADRRAISGTPPIHTRARRIIPGDRGASRGTPITLALRGLGHCAQSGAIASALAGCASYAPLPLPAHPGLARGLATLTHEGVSLEQPLGLAAVARLAIQNNPELVAARAQHGVARAQLLQVGLPPNPQVSGAALPLVAGFGTTLGWNAGLTYDFKALLTLSARRQAAGAAAAQVDADLVWQEWQVAGQARLLAVDLIADQDALAVLDRLAALFADRAGRVRLAVSSGDATLAALAPDLAAAQAARAARDERAGQSLARRHQLLALLGVAPDAPLTLAKTAMLPPVEPGEVLAGLAGLARRRPDLVALRLGYASQEQKVRAAILGQFPNLTFGVAGGSDNSNVRQAGPQISLELPLFDRNQGNIAIERTTRAQLRLAYTARVAAAEGQVRAMLAEIARLDAALAAARADEDASGRAAAHAEAAYASGDLDERGYVDLESTHAARAQDVIALWRAILEQRVALATLTGAGLPPVLPETRVADEATG